MNALKRLTAAFMAGVLTCALGAAPAFAVTPDLPAPSYQVALYAGGQGTFSAEGLPAGWVLSEDGTALHAQVDAVAPSAVSFDGIQVGLGEESPYYVKGVRPAAKNNGYQKYYVGGASEASVLSGSVTVGQDEDYVVAYGLKSQRVPCTVRYVDAQGVPIAPNATFIGDVGDVPAPVAAYVEGYLPRANTVTKTLVSNQAENVLTFNYVRVAGSTTVLLPGNIIAIVTPAGETIPVVPVGIPAAGAEGAGEAVPVTAADGTVILDDAGTPLAAPVAEESLDDAETPLASGADLTTQDQPVSEPFAAIPLASWLVPAGIGSAAAGLILFLVLLLRQRRKG